MSTNKRSNKCPHKVERGGERDFPCIVAHKIPLRNDGGGVFVSAENPAVQTLFCVIEAGCFFCPVFIELVSRAAARSHPAAPVMETILLFPLCAVARGAVWASAIMFGCIRNKNHNYTHVSCGYCTYTEQNHNENLKEPVVAQKRRDFVKVSDFSI